MDHSVVVVRAMKSAQALQRAFLKLPSFGDYPLNANAATQCHRIKNSAP
jgi:hypothetical protein